MTGRILAAALLVATACGDAAAPPLTTLPPAVPTSRAATTTTSPTGPVGVPAGAELGLGPRDRILTGAEPSGWTVAVAGTSVTIRAVVTPDPELRDSWTLRLRASDAGPEFLSGTFEREDSFGSDNRSVTLEAADLSIQDWDAAGVMSGAYAGAVQFSFWVDSRSPAIVRIASGESAEIPLGGLADTNQGLVQYHRLIEDSRCPPDVDCVQAGALIVELLVTGPDGAEPRLMVVEADTPSSISVLDAFERDGVSVAVLRAS